ncbi:ABC transporter permease [Tundrisphaera sp. TA3]|uniref:ABC transporter permease n=1 Tax=Tundrisphaera sp. TA3 TaxID=3435775 RepID=UPI003EBE4843
MTRPMRTGLAVVGLTIPVLAFLGLFSLSRGVRDLMGSTLGSMQSLIVMSENAPTPIFSDLPADMEESLRAIPGVAVVGPEVWRIAPPIDGKGGLAATALGALARPRAKGRGGLSGMVVIEGQDLPEHLKLKGAIFDLALLPPERGGGRFLNLGDIGKPNVVISTKIAGDFPNADGTPRRVGQAMRIGDREFTVVGLYETGSLVTDVTIVMDIGVARQLFGVPEHTVSTFAVEPTRVEDTDAMIQRIEEALPGVRAQRISQFNLTLGAVMGKLEIFLLLAVALATLVGGVGIANTMLMSTSERYVDFGVMRTTGWTRRDILALVTAESSLLGLISGSIGLVMAIASGFMVNRFLEGFRLEMGLPLMAAALAGAVTISTLSGLYPAWRASKMTPMDAIRRGGTT